MELRFFVLNSVASCEDNPTLKMSPLFRDKKCKLKRRISEVCEAGLKLDVRK